MRYLVNFSTGLASFEAARHTIESKSRENTTVIFCDVRGHPARDSPAAPLGSNRDGEDDDFYRKLHRVIWTGIVSIYGAGQSVDFKISNFCS